MNVCAKSPQSCLTLCDPVDCSPPGSSVHGTLQARILERVAMPSSMECSLSKDRTHVSFVSCTGRQVLYLVLGPPWEAHWMYRVVMKREREMNEFCLNQGQKYSQESGYICVASWKRNRVSPGRNKYEGCSRQRWVHTKVWLWKAVLNGMEFNLKSTEGPTGTFKSRTVILKLINVAMKSLNTF